MAQAWLGFSQVSVSNVTRIHPVLRAGQFKSDQDPTIATICCDLGRKNSPYENVVRTQLRSRWTRKFSFPPRVAGHLMRTSHVIENQSRTSISRQARALPIFDERCADKAQQNALK